MSFGPPGQPGVWTTQQQQQQQQQYLGGAPLGYLPQGSYLPPGGYSAGFPEAFPGGYPGLISVPLAGMPLQPGLQMHGVAAPPSPPQQAPLAGRPLRPGEGLPPGAPALLSNMAPAQQQAPQYLPYQQQAPQYFPQMTMQPQPVLMQPAAQPGSGESLLAPLAVPAPQAPTPAYGDEVSSAPSDLSAAAAAQAPAPAQAPALTPSPSMSAGGSGGSPGGTGGDVGGSGGSNFLGSGGLNKSRYRGVSYDRKKAKWRVQIKVAALGKSGVSVGYYDTEESAAQAYDRAAIGLLGPDNPNLQTNFPLSDYAGEAIPSLGGKSREEVKTTLKSERIKQAPRRRFTSRQRTSRYMGVGSSNRKNQWQARILVHGKVTHLGYYETEEEAAKVYDKVSLALHGPHAQTNFPAAGYAAAELAPYQGLGREELQRALGVKPMDKSSRFRGVSRKKGKWEAKVMVNRRWAYRELFDSEEEAARAYDAALWRLKPREARSYVNFKDEVPPGALLAEGGGGGYGSSVEDPDGGSVPGSDDEDDEDWEEGAGIGEGYGEALTGRPRRAAAARGRSDAMQRRRGSAPNLAALAAGGGAGPSFVMSAAGGLGLQMGGGAAAGQAAPVQQLVQQQPSQQQALDPLLYQALPAGMVPTAAAPALATGSQAAPPQPLLVRVGSETHLIPATQARRRGSPPAPGGAGGASTLGKRGMHRIQSEPHLHAAGRGGEPLSPLDSTDVADLMNDRDLFKGLDFGPGMHDDAMMGPLDLDSAGVLDFVRNSAGAGSPPPLEAGGRGSGMFKSRSANNLLLGSAAHLYADEAEALAGLEFAVQRPRKMSKSASVGNLSSLGGGGAAPLQPSGRPPLHPGVKDAPEEHRVGVLGRPMRRVNTFTSSLPTFEEGEEKPHMGNGHSSEEDLLNRLLGPPLGQHPMDDAMCLLGGGEGMA